VHLAYWLYVVIYVMNFGFGSQTVRRIRIIVYCISSVHLRSWWCYLRRNFRSEMHFCFSSFAFGYEWKQVIENQFGLLWYNTADICHSQTTISTLLSIIPHCRPYCHLVIVQLYILTPCLTEHRLNSLWHHLTGFSDAKVNKSGFAINGCSKVNFLQNVNAFRT